jgi:alpha-N-arabinofuranosidase
MRGKSLDVLVDTRSQQEAVYLGPTVPSFTQLLAKHDPPSKQLTKYIDVSAVIAENGKEVRVAIANRHETQAFTVPLVFGPNATVEEEVKVYEVWHEDLKANNTFGDEKVKTVEKSVKVEGSYEAKKHSFQSKCLAVYQVS